MAEEFETESGAFQPPFPEENTPEAGAEGKFLFGTRIRIDGALQKRLLKNLKIFAVLFCVFAAAFLFFGIAALFLVEGEEEISGAVYFFVLAAILALLAGLYFYMYFKNARHAERLAFTNVYDFFEHGVRVRSERRDGDTAGEVFLRYTDFFKVREKRRFFLLYPNSATAYPVDKQAITEAEAEALRGVLPLKRGK